MNSINYYRTLYYYDGPQVFEGRDAIGGHYVGLMVDPDAQPARYLIAGVEPKRLRQFKTGELDLVELLLRRATEDWYLSEPDGGLDSPMPIVLQESALADSPYLPEPGFVLHAQPATTVAVHEARSRNNLVMELDKPPFKKISELLGHFMTGVFLILVGHFGLWIGSVLVSFAGVLGTGYLDSVYVEIARGEEIDYSFLTLFCVFGYLTWLGIRAVVSAFGPDKPESAPPSEANNDKLRSARTVKSIKVKSVAVVTILLLSYTLIVGDHNIRRSSVLSFRQRAALIAPRISDREYKTILADYASMRSRADYDRLMQRIDVVAHEKGVPLSSAESYAGEKRSTVKPSVPTGVIVAPIPETSSLWRLPALGSDQNEQLYKLASQEIEAVHGSGTDMDAFKKHLDGMDGVDVSGDSFDRYSLLMVAVTNGNAACVKELLDRGAYVFVKGPRGGATPWSILASSAAKKGIPQEQITAIQSLLDKAADRIIRAGKPVNGKITPGMR